MLFVSVVSMSFHCSLPLPQGKGRADQLHMLYSYTCYTCTLIWNFYKKVPVPISYRVHIQSNSWNDKKNTNSYLNARALRTAKLAKKSGRLQGLTPLLKRTNFLPVEKLSGIWISGKFAKYVSSCHRILEHSGFKWTSRIIEFQPPCHGQGHALHWGAQVSIQSR